MKKKILRILTLGLSLLLLNFCGAMTTSPILYGNEHSVTVRGTGGIARNSGWAFKVADEWCRKYDKGAYPRGEISQGINLDYYFGCAK